MPLSRGWRGKWRQSTIKYDQADCKIAPMRRNAPKFVQCNIRKYCENINPQREQLRDRAIFARVIWNFARAVNRAKSCNRNAVRRER